MQNVSGWLTTSKISFLVDAPPCFQAVSLVEMAIWSYCAPNEASGCGGFTPLTDDRFSERLTYRRNVRCLRDLSCDELTPTSNPPPRAGSRFCLEASVPRAT